jgi:CubicO group peptidase (beta-lactamase class C family)
LLTHTSGYGYDFNVPLALRPAYDRAVHTRQFRNTRDMALWVANLPLQFNPGSGWQYGHSTDLLGYIIEVASGKSLDQFFDEYLFSPLKMVDTGFVLQDEQRSRLCSIYNYRKKEYELLEAPESCHAYDSNKILMGGAGLLSTPADYSRFFQMLLKYCDAHIYGSKKLSLSDTDIEEMSKNCLDPAFAPFNIGASIDYDTHGYGFAYQVKSLANPAVKDYRVSEGEYGWSGSFNTHFWIDPGKEIGAILMTQFAPFSCVPLEQEIKKLFYDALIL